MTTILTWYGHATLGIETGKFQLLVDPYFTGNPMAKVKAEDQTADYILVTHGHMDHVGDTISIAKRTGAITISNSEISNWLNKQGIKTHGQHLGGGYQHPFGYLKMTYALHGSSLPDGGYGGLAGGFLLTTPENKKIYMAGDTGLFGDMKLIGDEGIDLAVLPIGDNYTMGPADALVSLKLLRPKRVIPIHFNTFQVIKQDANAWAEKVKKDLNITVLVLNPGQSVTI